MDISVSTLVSIKTLKIMEIAFFTFVVAFTLILTINFNDQSLAGGWVTRSCSQYNDTARGHWLSSFGLHV